MCSENGRRRSVHCYVVFLAQKGIIDRREDWDSASLPSSDIRNFILLGLVLSFNKQLAPQVLLEFILHSPNVLLPLLRSLDLG